MNLTAYKLACSNVVDQLQCTVCLQKIEQRLYFIVPGEIIYQKMISCIKRTEDGLYNSRFKPVPANLCN